MADPRYHGLTFIGTRPTQQQLLNMRAAQFCYDHPKSYGWRELRVNKKHSLWVYHQAGVELMRCPKGDGWVVTYLGERRRVRLHVSELSRKLDTIKRQIEAQLSQTFTAAMAA